MDFQIRKHDGLFLLVCFGLGLLAEISFLHGRIGLSYLVFVAGFYLVIFLRFKLSFNHRRIGLLFMVAIWVLSGSYLMYDNSLFHNLNILIIPILVFSHIVLITSPNTFTWNTPHFISLLKSKWQKGRRYSFSFCYAMSKKIFKNTNKQAAQTLKRVIAGIVIGIPLLLLIIGLLMSADAVFEEVILRLPQFILRFNFLEGVFRFAFVVIVGLIFFGIIQVLQAKPKQMDGLANEEKKKTHWDSVIAVTILVMLNAVYLLFAVIQFRYFFSSGLIVGFSYAEYARRGFFELILIMIINWTILTSFLKFVKVAGTRSRYTLNILYSLLIIVSGIMLTSAFIRLSMYEAAYGFTLDRILAHAFMIFLMIVFAYTLIRVWMERISLLHFYLIMGLIFYTMLNAINIEQIIVDKNMERYEQTGKIDIYYLNSLSYTGWNGLIELYKQEEDYPDLKEILLERQQWVENQTENGWQSFNFAKQRVTKRLKELDI